MGGNNNGARKGAETKRKKYGDDFFSKIGHLGGSKSTPGNFGTTKMGTDGLTGKERASKTSKEYWDAKRLKEAEENPQ